MNIHQASSLLHTLTLFDLVIVTYTEPGGKRYYISPRDGQFWLSEDGKVEVVRNVIALDRLTVEIVKFGDQPYWVENDFKISVVRPLSHM